MLQVGKIDVNITKVGRQASTLLFANPGSRTIGRGGKIQIDALSLSANAFSDRRQPRRKQIEKVARWNAMNPE